MLLSLISSCFSVCRYGGGSNRFTSRDSCRLSCANSTLDVASVSDSPKSILHLENPTHSLIILKSPSNIGLATTLARFTKSLITSFLNNLLLFVMPALILLQGSSISFLRKTFRPSSKVYKVVALFRDFDRGDSEDEPLAERLRS